MRVAALYDIHANLPALEAVLAEVLQEDVDRILIGGDVVPGPMPREVFDRLDGLRERVSFIRGNGDRDTLAAYRGEPLTRVPEPFHEVLHWVSRKLTTEQLEAMTAWPLTARLQIDAIGRVLFCHATPRDDNEIFTRSTPEERLRPIFDTVDADLVVCGHTHMPFDRVVGQTRVINAGSVGMPFGAPGAYWLLLGADVEFRRTMYDVEEAEEGIRRSGYPQASGFRIAQPPTESEMLALFDPAAIGD